MSSGSLTGASITASGVAADTTVVSVDRSKLKWDGPPSQKAALSAVYLGHLALAVGALGIVARNGTVTTVSVLMTIALYFVAFFLERRERRREKTEQRGPFGR